MKQSGLVDNTNLIVKQIRQLEEERKQLQKENESLTPSKKTLEFLRFHGIDTSGIKI